MRRSPGSAGWHPCFAVCIAAAATCPAADGALCPLWLQAPGLPYQLPRQVADFPTLAGAATWQLGIAAGTAMIHAALPPFVSVLALSAHHQHQQQQKPSTPSAVCAATFAWAWVCRAGGRRHRRCCRWRSCQLASLSRCTACPWMYAMESCLYCPSPSTARVSMQPSRRLHACQSATVS